MTSFFRSLTGCVLFLVVVSAFPGQCYGSLDETKLIPFWKGNSNLDEDSARTHELYKAALKDFGVVDANSLDQFLHSEEYRAQALYSMSLLADSTGTLKPAIADEVINFTTNAAVGEDVRKAALRSVTSYYPQDTKIRNYVKKGLSHFVAYGANPLESEGPDAGRSAELSAEWMFFLGEAAAEEKEKIPDLLGLAQTVVSIKVAASQEGGYSMTVPSDDPNSFHKILGAMRWPLFEDPKLATSCARIFLGYLKRTPSLPRHARSEDIKPAIDFLLQKSKADPDFLAQKIGDLVKSSDANFASVVLWILNDSKDSPVAKKALGIIASDEKNKDLLLAIQAGRRDKAEAYEKPLAEIYLRQQDSPKR